MCEFLSIGWGIGGGGCHGSGVTFPIQALFSHQDPFYAFWMLGIEVKFCTQVVVQPAIGPNPLGEAAGRASPDHILAHTSVSPRPWIMCAR